MTPKRIDYILKNSTVIFYDKQFLGGECYVNFKVDIESSFRVFSERLFVGAVVELIDTHSKTLVEADVLALSLNRHDTYTNTNMTGSCVLQLHGEYILSGTFQY